MTVIDYILNNWDNTLRFNTEDEDNLIGLPKPYTVPSMNERFNSLYYWDTYFTNVGLILSGKLGQAINNTENIAYLINRYGHMPNGNRTNFLNRSQPPFFSMMVRDIYDITGDLKWLSEMYASVDKEYSFWIRNRQTENGLSRYYHSLKGDEPEQMIRESAAYLVKRYKVAPATDLKTAFEYAENIRITCESGWDCNSRFGMNNQNHNWIDLNSLMYSIEKNMEYFSTELQNGETHTWRERAEKRLERMNSFCLTGSGYFADYDIGAGKVSDFVSLASFYPMFVGALTAEQARATVALLPRLEMTYGLACCEKRDDLLDLQWDYPNGWGCLHFIVIRGLLRYGYENDALRIAQKYCDLVESCYEKTGNLWEVYNVVLGAPSVTKEKSGTVDMMGWSAGVYLYCKYLVDGKAGYYSK